MTALGPAALLAIAAASRQPGSKVGSLFLCEKKWLKMSSVWPSIDHEGDYLHGRKSQHRLGELAGGG